MKDLERICKIAVVQASPVLFDKEACLQKALRLAGEAGALAIGGMEMLVYQAVAAHEIWYGTRFRPEDIDALCQDAGEELARLFPGNG